jgi:tetratricopeptide (TPR) repeat protein
MAGRALSGRERIRIPGSAETASSACLGLRQADEAISLASRALELGRRADDAVAEANAAATLGQAFHDSGRSESARHHREQAYRIYARLGDPRAADLLRVPG